MKRLTMKDENGYYLTGDGIYSDWGVPEKFRGEDIDRLAAIEDILCDGTDEYDLDRLRVLCNQRMTMREEVSERFSLTAKIPLDRLRELAEADREGRCVVLPIKIPGWGWYCNSKFPNAISAYFDYPSQVVGCMEDYTLRGTKEEAEAALATDC